MRQSAATKYWNITVQVRTLAALWQRANCAKQSQFAKGQNEHKYLFSNGLRRRPRSRAVEKESQFKPKCEPFAGRTKRDEYVLIDSSNSTIERVPFEKTKPISNKLK
jgi:hypothetical protein